VQTTKTLSEMLLWCNANRFYFDWSSTTLLNVWLVANEPTSMFTYSTSRLSLYTVQSLHGTEQADSTNEHRKCVVIADGCGHWSQWSYRALLPSPLT